MKKCQWISSLVLMPLLAVAEPPVIKELWNPVLRPPGTAPGAMILLKGSGFSGETILAAAPPYPFKLGGVRVLVDRVECPLMFVSPGAIQAQLPFGITTDRSSFAIDIAVQNADGETTIQTSLGRTTPSLVTESRDGNVFTLKVAGQEVSRKEVTIPVR